MTKFDESLSNVLNTTSDLMLPDEISQQTLPVEYKIENSDEDDIQKEIDSDNKQVRENLKKLLDKGNDLLDNLITLSKSDQKIGYFEAAKDLIQTLSNVNEKIITVNEKRLFQSSPNDQKADKTPENTTVVFASTDELNAILGLSQRHEVIDVSDFKEIKPKKKLKKDLNNE